MKVWIITWLSATALLSPSAFATTPIEPLMLDQILGMAESLQPEPAEKCLMLEDFTDRIERRRE